MASFNALWFKRERFAIDLPQRGNPVSLVAVNFANPDADVAAYNLKPVMGYQ